MLAESTLQEDLIIDIMPEIQVIETCPNHRFHRYNELLEDTKLILTYKAYDADTGREVCWNILNFRRISKREAKSFVARVKALVELNHENIVKCLGYWVSKQNQFVFVTQMTTGGNLKHYLNKISPPKLKIIKGWCQEIFKAIEYVHCLHPNKFNIITRCRNIYINANSNQIKLGYQCFLLTSSSHENTEDIPWLAPEVSEGDHSEASQVYSFGMTLLEIITNQTPYEELPNDIQVLRSVLLGNMPASTNMISNHQLRNLILQCIRPKNERLSFKEVYTQQVWKTQDCDNSRLQISKIQHNQYETLPTLNFEFTKLIQNKHYKNERESEATTTYVSEKNKRFQIKVLVADSDREELDQFMNFLKTRLDIKEQDLNKDFEDQDTNLCLVREAFSQSIRTYFNQIQQLILHIPVNNVDDFLLKKFAMQKKQLQSKHREELQRIHRLRAKNKSSLVNWFDIMSFHMDSLESRVYNDFKNIIERNQEISFTYSSIDIANKSYQQNIDDSFECETTTIYQRIVNEALLAKSPCPESKLQVQGSSIFQKKKPSQTNSSIPFQ